MMVGRYCVALLTQSADRRSADLPATGHDNLP
jgi:hypothetical protein